MKKFLVTLEQKRFETAQVAVKANSPEEAEERALAKAGDLKWTLGEVDEGSTYAAECKEAP